MRNEAQRQRGGSRENMENMGQCRTQKDLLVWTSRRVAVRRRSRLEPILGSEAVRRKAVLKPSCDARPGVGGCVCVCVTQPFVRRPNASMIPLWKVLGYVLLESFC